MTKLVAAYTTTDWKNESIRYCTQADIPTIIADVKRHEGVGLNPRSHIAIFNSDFIKQGLGAKLEAVVFPLSDAFPGRVQARSVLSSAVAAALPDMTVFDFTDVGTMSDRIGCQPDYDQSNRESAP